MITHKKPAQTHNQTNIQGGSNVEKFINNVKLGFISYIYPPPPEISKPLECLRWQIQKAHELECEVIHVSYQMPTEESEMEELKRLLGEYNIELELRASRDIFELTGPNAKQARENIQKSIDYAKYFDVRIMRNGYGTLKAETTRYNKSKPVREQLDFLVKNLKEAARIYEDNGMLYALENHCDFTGKELAWVFEQVNSPNVGAALDTANGFSIYCDPNDDIRELAPYTITTHIKDSKIMDYEGDDIIPYLPLGCPLGEGNVDLEMAIDLLMEKSPHAYGLHLVLEQGWYGGLDKGYDRRLYNYMVMEKGLEYLKKLITK